MFYVYCATCGNAGATDGDHRCWECQSKDVLILRHSSEPEARIEPIMIDDDNLEWWEQIKSDPLAYILSCRIFPNYIAY
jgi:hypothetical protein